jgi:hypothetical protein
MVAWVFACLVAAEALVALEIVFRPWLLAFAYGLVIAVLQQVMVLRRLGVRARTWIPLTALGGCLAAFVAIFVTIALFPNTKPASLAFNAAFAGGGLAAGAVLGAAQVVVFGSSSVRWLWLAGSVVAGPFVVPLEVWLFGYPTNSCGLAFGFDGACNHIWLSPTQLAAVAGLAYGSFTAPALALLIRRPVHISRTRPTAPNL